MYFATKATNIAKNWLLYKPNIYLKSISYFFINIQVTQLSSLHCQNLLTLDKLINLIIHK